MTEFPPDVLKAIERSIFAEVSHGIRAPMFAGGMLAQIPAGVSIGDSEGESRVMLVVSGTFRMFYTDESGKQLTVRYIAPGEIMGLVAAIGGHFPLEVEALEDAMGWVVPGEQITRVASQNAELAWTIARECTRRLAGVFAELTTVAFGSIRDRLMRHLLKLAETRRSPADAKKANKATRTNDHIANDARRPVLIRATQQELADAVGTSREVIARSLRELRDREILSARSETPGTLEIPDLNRLHRELASSLLEL